MAISDFTRVYPRFKQTRPHVEVNYDDSSLRGNSGASEKDIALIGSATNGKPNTIYEITSSLQARTVFGSGELVDAAELAWGSKDTGDVGTIYAMRIEDATPAELKAAGVKFVSKVYGDSANNITVKMERNDLTKAMRVTVDYKDAKYHKVYDSIGQMFKLQYQLNDPINGKATYDVVKTKEGRASKFVLNIHDAKVPVTSTTTSTTSTSTSTTASTTIVPDDTTTTTTNKNPVYATAIRFDVNEATIKSGDAVKLSYAVTPEDADVSTLTFSSDNEGIAKVDASGRVTTSENTNGIANIKVSVKDASGKDVSDVLKLTVSPTADTVGNTTVAKFALEADSDNGMVDIQQSFDLTNSEYDTIFGLMQALQKIPNMLVYMLKGGDNTEIKTAYLDEAKEVDISQDINDYEKAGYVWALQGDLVDKLQWDNYIYAEADLGEKAPDPFSEVHLAGGKTGEIPISWESKMRQFLQVPAYYLVPVTQSEAVHEEAREVVNNSYELGHSMRAFVGAGINEGIGQLISRQQDLQDGRVALVGTSGYVKMNDGRDFHAAGYMLAAKAAGVASQLSIGGAITNKYVNLESIDQNFTSSDYDLLNQNGVIMFEPISNRGVDKGFRFVQDVTTYNSTTEPIKQRISLGEITDFLFDDLRFYLEENYIGQNVKVSTADILKNAVDSFLDRQVRDGLIVAYDSSDTQVVIDADRAWIGFTIQPSQTLDYITVYGAFSNYKDSSGKSTALTNAGITSGDSTGSVIYSKNTDSQYSGSYNNSNWNNDYGSNSSRFGTINHNSSNGLYH